MHNSKSTSRKTCWNKGKLVGQKLPLKLEEIWSIRIRLELENNLRELTMFNLALDSYRHLGNEREHNPPP